MKQRLLSPVWIAAAVSTSILSAPIRTIPSTIVFYPDRIAGPPLGPGETYTHDEEVWDWYYAVDDDYFQYLYDLCEDNAENIGWKKVESGGE